MGQAVHSLPVTKLLNYFDTHSYLTSFFTFSQRRNLSAVRPHGPTLRRKDAKVFKAGELN